MKILFFNVYAEFDLTFNRPELERIYFSKLRSSLLWSPLTRKPFAALIGMLLCTLGLLTVFGLMQEPIILVLATGFALGFLAAVSDYIKKMKVQMRRNEEIKRYLTFIENTEKHRLLLKEKGIVLQQDREESTANWESFSYIKAYKDHLKLGGKIDLIIPTCGLSKEELAQLQQLLNAQIKHQPHR